MRVNDEGGLIGYRKKLRDARLKAGHKQIMVGKQPARIFLRDNIEAYLRDEGVSGVRDLKKMVLMMSGLSMEKIEDRNIFDWALVDLQRMGRIIKVAQQGQKWRYGHIGEPYFVARSNLPALRWDNKILWTGGTLNCIVGCSKVSRACKHCYAARMTTRFNHPLWEGVSEYRSGKYLWTGRVNFDINELHRRVKQWGSQPRLVFFTSLSDPFYKELTDGQVQAMLDACESYPHIMWQWLTKNPVRAAEFKMPFNIWLGATVESESELARVDELRASDARIKFLSCEPLTTDELPSLDLTGIDWVIVGGESGPGAEPMDPDWARSLRDRCFDARVPMFFKQWGKYGDNGLRIAKGAAQTMLDGCQWLQFPLDALHHMEAWKTVPPSRVPPLIKPSIVRATSMVKNLSYTPREALEAKSVVNGDASISKRSKAAYLAHITRRTAKG